MLVVIVIKSLRNPKAKIQDYQIIRLRVRKERVWAAKAADTIVVARTFSRPMFSANPARNC